MNDYAGVYIVVPLDIEDFNGISEDEMADHYFELGFGKYHTDRNDADEIPLLEIEKDVEMGRLTISVNIYRSDNDHSGEYQFVASIEGNEFKKEDKVKETEYRSNLMDEVESFFEKMNWDLNMERLRFYHIYIKRY
jgi:hypothetical protein